MTLNQHILLASAWLALVGGIAVSSVSDRQSDMSPAEADLFADEAALFGEEDEALPSGVGLAFDFARAIDTGADTVVSAVLDGAILLRRGEVYSLHCCDAQKEPDNGVVKPDLIDLRRDAGATRLARSYHQKLYINPFALAGKVRVEARKEGHLTRYLLFPGSDEQAFTTFRLRAGDRVLGVNGVSLQRGDAIPTLYQQLAVAEHVTVTLERDGRPVVVLLALDASA